jgi:hypothetical protein
VDERIELSPDLAGNVVAWPDRPDITAALRSHLAYYLTAGDAAALEDRYDLPRLCGGLAGQPMRSVDEVARAAADAFRASQPFEALLKDLGFGAADRVAKWFGSRPDPDPEGLGLLLAITVLGGCGYGTVARHARRLEELVADRSRIQLHGRRLDPLRPRSQRVHEAMAVLERGFSDTGYGRPPAETVRLESRWLVHAVLGAVWHEYDLLADALLAWLRETGDDPDPAVRLRAAAAAGWLAQDDFAALQRELLSPWAQGSTEAARAAAGALGQAAWLDSTAPLALGLLSMWARGGDYDLWWTAAVAYGGEAGVRYPAVAMDHLLALSMRDDDRAAPVAAHSAIRLATSGGRFTPEIAAFVLAHLAGWLDDSPPAALTARQAYAGLLHRAADPDWPSSARYLEILAGPQGRDASAALLRAALADRVTRGHALDSVEALVRAADYAADIREQVAILLAAAASPRAGPDTDRQRLLHYLNRWAGEPDPSPAAREIAGRLQEATQA